MHNERRGIRCNLPALAVGQLLLRISKLEYSFYIPWCLSIDRSDQIIPKSFENTIVTALDLAYIAKSSIFELVLHLYVPDSSIRIINNYEDFLQSSCECCLIYYDCGCMDIYIKEDSLFEVIMSELTALKAEELIVLTDLNDGRTVLYP